MHRYITLLKLTSQGATATKSHQRAHLFNQVAAKAGVRIEGPYWTQGAYDGVLIMTAEREADAMRVPLALAAAGNLETQTIEELVQTEAEPMRLEAAHAA